MLSDKGASDSLLGNYKEPSRKYEPKIESVSDQIQQPKQSKQSQIKETKKQSKSEKVKKKGKQEKLTFVLKIINIILGLLILGFSIFCYYQINRYHRQRSFPVLYYIMPGYIAFSGLIILAIEMRIGLICRNMKFLYNYFGRGFFNIYVGIMPISLIDDSNDSNQKQQEKILIYILASLLVSVGLLYMISKIFCCAVEKNNRKLKKAESEPQNESGPNDE